ncbi:MAG: polyphosphate kinase 1 [Egibacteraceae bacterium]
MCRDPTDRADPRLFLNRELSWLQFNRRVLAQAADPAVPLLERIRFVAIFGSNLDEFFMIRVAGLKAQLAAGVRRRTPDGRTPAQQLQEIDACLHPMVREAYACLHGELLPELAAEGIPLHRLEELPELERQRLAEHYDEQVFPVLTPLAVDPSHPFPYISGLSLSLAVTLRDREAHERRFARVKVPAVLPRLVALGSRPGWVLLEDLIAVNLARLFPGMEVVEAHLFRVTRNADFDVEEDEADDLLLAIQAELRKRRFGAVVRLEVAGDMPERVVALLQDELGVGEPETYRIEGLLGLSDLHGLADHDAPHLRWAPWEPVVHTRLPHGAETPARQLFAELRRGDLLTHHPYDSFTATTERLVTAAADDPAVLAIKLTLYRTSGDSPTVRALMRAAEHGKQVVVLVELRARFDEEANIRWARALEKVGVHVVYGLAGLKTHSKIALVVRREAGGIRRYVHVGTGNYNPQTAKLYTDLGLLTADADLGADVSELFNVLTGYARQRTYRHLLVAPTELRTQLGERIRREVEAHGEERPGLIRAQLNSLIDPLLIAELYRAAQAGVRIELVVRGICGLRPGVPGVSEGIRVTSVVGRFLEHCRVLQFSHGGYWLGSADWMPRNLDRRVEVMVPVRDPELQQRLAVILDLLLADNTHAWDLGPDGSWTRRQPGDGEEPVHAQAVLMQRARERGEGGEGERPRV